MRTPKLLPWYARKAGVSEKRAASLWRKAVRQATETTGWVGNAEYWGETMNIFRELLEEERASFCALSVTPLIRSQSRLVTVSLNALETMMCASANWYRGTTGRAALPLGRLNTRSPDNALRSPSLSINWRFTPGLKTGCFFVRTTATTAPLPTGTPVRTRRACGLQGVLRL